MGGVSSWQGQEEAEVHGRSYVPNAQWCFWCPLARGDGRLFFSDCLAL